MNSALLAIAVSLVISYLLTPVAGKLAWKFGAIAKPGDRHVHTTPTPRFGGVAIYAGFLISVLVVLLVNKGVTHSEQIIGVLLGGTLVAIVGVLDDKYDLSPMWQVLGIVAGTVVLIYFGIKIRHSTNPFNAPKLLWLNALAIPITIVWVFGVTKTIDLIDGMDGLASGVCAIGATTLLIMAVLARVKEPWLAGSFQNVAILAGALLGASLGFLRHNYPPAKIFMGTVGSQFMGFVLAALSIIGAFKVAALVAFAVPLFALGVPIFDAAFVVVRRFIERRPVHLADKSHMHHRLLDRGLSQGQVVLIIYGLTIALSATALTMYWVCK